jgi:hypothetical protein
MADILPAARPADGTGNATLADAAPLALSSSKRIGDEMLLVYRAIER